MNKVLVIDDEPMILETIRRALESEGYEVSVAASGAKGLEELRGSSFDLTIVDILMPEMDGIEIIREMKRISPSLNVIAISGGGRIDNSSFLSMAEQLGANDSLKKPFSLMELRQRVGNLCGANKH